MKNNNENRLKGNRCPYCDIPVEYDWGDGSFEQFGEVKGNFECTKCGRKYDEETEKEITS